MTGVLTGHDPRVLQASTDKLLVVALHLASGKVMTTEGDGAHVELPLTGEHRAVRGTRCYMNLEAFEPTLPQRLTPSPSGLDAIARVNIYVSPAGCGTPLHFDVRDVLIVQLFGEKRWEVAAETAVENPPRNCVFPANALFAPYEGRQLPQPATLHEFLLKPGDWLRVPKGVWHRTHTRGGSVSASLAAPGVNGDGT